jgi:hypothetical protein
VDIKEILYTEIDNVGKNHIRFLLSNDVYNSKTIINSLFNKCSVLLNKDNPFEDEFALFAEALLHFVLTVSMIPAERKINVDGIDIDILVPNAKNLKNNSDKAIIIHFHKYKKENMDETINNLSKIQKKPNNIWIVSSNKINLNVNTFIVSPVPYAEKNNKGLIYPFSDILIKINEFLKNINYSGLKII